MDIIWLAAGVAFFLASCSLMQFFHNLRAED
jgi:hypothetical protein